MGERFGVVGFGDVPQADFGARRLGRRSDALRHRGAMTGGRIVDDRNFGHGVIVGIAVLSREMFWPSCRCGVNRVCTTAAKQTGAQIAFVNRVNHICHTGLSSKEHALSSGDSCGGCDFTAKVSTRRNSGSAAGGTPRPKVGSASITWTFKAGYGGGQPVRPAANDGDVYP